MRLDRFSPGGFDRGASRPIEALWLVMQAVLLSSWLPGSRWRCGLLRAFGAQVGDSVIIKPGVRVKFPWRLRIGDHSWIGEDVWIDNLTEVMIGSHVCISQGAYLCTGSHDWTCETFDLVTRSITLEDHVWVGAKAVLAPGSELGTGAVLSIASLGKGRLEAWTIYSGMPAVPERVRPRQAADTSD